MQQPGSYIVDTEEEEVEAASPPVYRLVRTVFRLVAVGVSRLVEIDPENLERAVRQDSDNAGLFRFANAPDRDFGRDGGDPVADVPARAMITRR